MPETTSLFNKIAKHYDSLNTFFSFGMDKLWRKQLAEQIRGSQLVLDIATGTGEVAIETIKKLEEKGQIESEIEYYKIRFKKITICIIIMNYIAKKSKKYNLYISYREELYFMEFVQVVETLIKQLQGYLLGLIGVITTIMVAIYGVKFLMGDSGDKSESITNIKKTLIMGGGIFFLVWFSGEVITKFKGV